MSIVRKARAGTIENARQEEFVTTVELVNDVRSELSSTPLLSRIRGCLLGGALGDSLGEPVEFIASAQEITARFGSDAPARLGYSHPSRITDDTQMTVFAAEGIIRAGEARWEVGGALVREAQRSFLRWLATQEKSDPEEVAASPAGWLVSQPALHARRAPGNTCLSALGAQRGARNLATVDAGLNDSKGCGAVMRSAPYGIAARTREQAFQWARDSGAITHSHPSGYLSAAHFGAVIWGVIRGESLPLSVARASALLVKERGPEETTAAVMKAMALIGPKLPSAETIESLGRAWVGEEALAIALLCAGSCRDGSPTEIRRALWRSVAHAGDSDSTGSMVGNLLGAIYGFESLPEEWLGELELRGVIDRVARDLHAALEGIVDPRAYPMADEPARNEKSRSSVREFEWYGVTRREPYSDWVLTERDSLADAARAYDWPSVLSLVEASPVLANAWRPGGTSWYAPLHQAAHGNAPESVVVRLLELGAWRSLRNAKGETPRDVARKRGHQQVASLLEPKPVRTIDKRDLDRLQSTFRTVILDRIAVLDDAVESLRLPELEPLTEYDDARFWFAVPGMYGGFLYWLAADGTTPKLVSVSWSRVVGGSGQRHEITLERARLVEEGFA